jgi:eukaryotic-like serine/threonine-protein kinase
MSVTGPLVLAPDVLIIPAKEVDDDMRRMCECGDDDYILTRPRSRTQSRVLNRDAAELVQLFREPRTIVEAVLRICDAHGGEPQETLEQAFTILRPIIQARWLVPEGSDEAHQIATTLHVGDVIEGWSVIGCIQLLEDTEVYQVRSGANDLAALKLARSGASHRLRQAFAKEARILDHLDGPPAPRLIVFSDRPHRLYLVSSWCQGIPVDRAAAELHSLRSSDSRRRLLELCVAVAQAYAVVHERGVIHGDVFPKNILVDAQGAVSILDYGLSALMSAERSGQSARRGVPEYYDPEYAAAVLSKARRPPIDQHSEQYALAVLFYRLITGVSYLNLSAVKTELLRQIAEDHPRAFAAVGVPGWRQLETILGIGLRKKPSDRFETVAAFAAALRDVIPPAVANTVRRLSAETLALISGVLSNLDAEMIDTFPLSPMVPSASVSYGAAGVAYGLYCAACARNNPELLAAADAWSTRALVSIHQPNAFSHPGLGLQPQAIGAISLYFAEPGVHLVQAMISQAMGDGSTFSRAMKDFVGSSRTGAGPLDLTLGRAGLLLGCALVLDAVGPGTLQAETVYKLSDLLDYGRTLQATLWDEVSAAYSVQRSYLGVAHGLAGICYSTLLWSEVSGDALPPKLLHTLDELGRAAQAHGRGLRWPVRETAHSMHGAGFMESWCHGAPGYVHLWTAAFRAYHEDCFQEMAERSAWTAWEAPDAIGSLCCGYAGRAYALLAQFRQSGDPNWVDRAVVLAERAIAACKSDTPTTHALFKGLLGAVVLVEDLRAPEFSSFPLFERETRHA